MSESEHGTAEHRTVGSEPDPTSLNRHSDCSQAVLSEVNAEGSKKDDKRREEGVLLKTLFEKMKRLLNTEELDEETTRMTERVVVLRIATKHINLWMRQLEMKRKEMSELAELMRLEMVRVRLRRRNHKNDGQGDAHTTSPRR